MTFLSDAQCVLVKTVQTQQQLNTTQLVSTEFPKTVSNLTLISEKC